MKKGEGVKPKKKVIETNKSMLVTGGKGVGGGGIGKTGVYINGGRRRLEV